MHYVSKYDPASCEVDFLCHEIVLPSRPILTIHAKIFRNSNINPGNTASPLTVAGFCKLDRGRFGFDVSKHAMLPCFDHTSSSRHQWGALVGMERILEHR